MRDWTEQNLCRTRQ